MTGPQTITAAEAARRLGVNKSTMTRWIAAGKVPAVRQGDRWRVRVTWVDAELARGEREDMGTKRVTIAGAPYTKCSRCGVFIPDENIAPADHDCAHYAAQRPARERAHRAMEQRVGKLFNGKTS